MTNDVKHKSIIHLDMDAFYPAVEVLDNPSLKGKPVIVGGTMGRGVVSSASYEARKFGVHSAQPMAKAMRQCRHGIFLPVRMSRYQEVSGQVFEIFCRFTPLVEPLSIDEAFLDVTGCIRLFGNPVDIAKNIKEMVRKETGLTVSAGVAPSKFVAKIASDMDKPDGLTVVLPDKVREFLDPLPIGKMWGVGKVTKEALAQLNIHTFRDLIRIPVEVLEKKFGKYGLKMHELSMGIDERDVVIHQEAKSIGHEETFSEDILNIDLAKKELLALAGKVARRLRREGVKGKTITLKVKYSNFVLITRSMTLNKFTNDGAIIYTTACGLLDNTEAGKKPVRLLGISLSQLSIRGAEKQLSLFNEDVSNNKRKKLNITLDSLQDRFGENIVRPGTLIDE
uniref:DNA polymerase IV n=1 Tax=Candidatus Desulfatibia profunda TaxID=2841695 RepID=A0A8J6TKX0_9BACT|nr:DNA polymerase IV [Candidatus Desulfatibia profunda]